MSKKRVTIKEFANKYPEFSVDSICFKIAFHENEGIEKAQGFKINEKRLLKWLRKTEANDGISDAYQEKKAKQGKISCSVKPKAFGAW